MINGSMLRDAFLSGANNISNHKQQVDELNVFPVPDGDTGTNMSMTINNAKPELQKLSDPTVSQVADVAASALLRGARGNSGVILSLLFRGFSKGLKGLDEMGGADLARALQLGVEAAYKSVMKPTEGTVLTVSRLAAEKAVEFAKTNDDPFAVFNVIVEEANAALQQTPELLPVLKKAGVVDAGGQGFVVVLEGMKSVFQDGEIIQPLQKEAPASPVVMTPKNAAAEMDANIEFTYCTEFIVNKSKTAKGALALRAYLESIGDSVVVVDDDDIIKVHVHTENPGNALQEGLKFGTLTKMKIENMKEQHENKVYEAQQTAKGNDYVPVDPDRPFGFVAVAAGEGLQGLFEELGVDKIVSGGQTMNPSTEDILRAIQAVPAETVFVLPNNKNIIMAAEQAVPLADRKVCVLQTRTIPQGLSAMLAYDPDENFEANRLAMTKALDHVSTGQITFAARDSDFDGHKIKQGEILGLENGKLALTEKDSTKALLKLTRRMVKQDSSFITLIYGEDIPSEQAEEAYNALRSKVSDHIEINMVDGGQPVYYYIVSVE